MIKVGDWVRDPSAPDVVRKVTSVDPDGFILAGTFVYPMRAIIQVHPPKDRKTRKLNLSEAIAWLKTQAGTAGPDRPRSIHISVDGEWIISASTGKTVGHGSTLLGAIIAARKTLRVKG